MPGPLPDPNAIRRNAPTIPTLTLPLSGRKGPAPDVPIWVQLGTAGSAWWAWAWATPQAVAWGTSVGMEATVARRAQLEDMLADTENPASIHRLIAPLDKDLGLTPKGMADLRWKIVDDTPAVEPETPAAGTVTGINSRRGRLTDAS
jgi:hypothetical protein